MWVKKNDSSVTGWTELIHDGTGSDPRHSFRTPPFASNDLTIYAGQQYIWRYRTVKATYVDASRYNGFVSPVTGSHRFAVHFQYQNDTNFEYAY